MSLYNINKCGNVIVETTPMDYTHTPFFFILKSTRISMYTCVNPLWCILNKTSSIYPLIPTQYLSDNTHDDYGSKTNYFQDRKDL